MNEVSGAPLFSAERWIQLRAMLDDLLALTPEQRESRLLDMANRNAGEAASMRRLLADSEKSPDLHTQPMLDAQPAHDVAVPERLGPFRLRERIGTGGMGMVYLAEREHADFTQRVALKLLDTANTNMTRLAARERRILSALAHPNITAFVDAGVEQGHAWIAMEYVDGDSLLDHCRNQHFGIRERLGLFDQVCAAVAHAHAQLVVHRDLKPSNILVNRQGTAKLLDFGIALALESTDESAPATRIFTPEYAAPEQLRGERVTTATDVHALGLILFELITQRRLRILERGTQSEEWTGRELSRLATLQPASTEASASGVVAGNSKSVQTLLHGDLGRIIAHALNPDPAKRYASVALLREDLSRWLDHRPLTIVRPAMSYVMRRFLRRHRLAATLAGAGFLSIVGLAAAALWQARAKSLEAQRAQAALHQSEVTREFVSSIFMSADPYQGKGLETNAADLLKAARERIDTELSGEPEIAAALLNQIGNVYVALIDNAATRAVFAKALEYNARSPRPSVLMRASIESRLAYIDYLENKDPSELKKLDDAIGELRALGTQSLPELARSLDLKSSLEFEQGEHERALATVSESVDIYRSLGSSQDQAYLQAVLGKADLLATMERNEEAVSATDLALASDLLQKPENSALLQSLLGVRARGLAGLRRYAEAEPVMARVIESLSANFGREHAQTRYWRYRRVEVLDWMGRLDEASAEIRQLLEAKPSSDVHPVASIAERVEALNIDVQRRAETVEASLKAARSAACGENGAPPFCAKVKLVEASMRLRVGKIEQAQSLLETMQNDPLIGGNAVLRGRLLLLRAGLARHQGKFEIAQKQLEEIRASADTSVEQRAKADIEQGYLALAMGDTGAALPLLKRGRAYLAEPLVKLTPEVIEIDAALARVEGAH
ncbi:MAG: serine/threonine protein kinase [Gammaproteobacteria bacterium]|nr:MAG: serine/threonine protein kinase [Gammaproteobacteria bacterium]